MEKLYRKPYTKTAELKTFNFRPFLFVATFFSLGITFAYLCKYQNVSLWWCLLPLSILAIGVFFFCGVAPAKRICLSTLLLALAFLSGFGGLHAQVNAYEKQIRYNGEYVVLARVVESVETEWNTVLTVDKVSVDGQKTNGKVCVYLRTDRAQTEDIRLGDKLLLRGKLSDNVEKFHALSIDENCRHTMIASECIVVGHSFNVFLTVRNRVKEVLYAGMDDDVASIVMAITAGDTSGIQTETLENMRRGGIAHIFAVSGLHIGALFAFCLWIIKRTRLKSASGIVRFLFVSAVLVLYGGVCGFSASVVRSLTTCLVLYGATLTRIGSDALERVAFSALVVLLRSPVSLFLVGFQLTFSACLGILLLHRPIYESVDSLVRFVFTKKGDKQVDEEGHPPSIRECAYMGVLNFLSVTLSAQIATAPVLLYSFGYLSLWSLVLNFVFVPIVSASFSALLALSVVACILPLIFAKFVLYFPALLFSLVLFVFEVVDFSSFCIQNVVLTKATIALYYSALLFFTDKWNLGKKQKTLLGLLLVFACIFTLFLTNYR